MWSMPLQYHYDVFVVHGRDHIGFTISHFIGNAHATGMMGAVFFYPNMLCWAAGSIKTPPKIKTVFTLKYRVQLSAACVPGKGEDSEEGRNSSFEQSEHGVPVHLHFFLQRVSRIYRCLEAQ